MRGTPYAPSGTGQTSAEERLFFFKKGTKNFFLKQNEYTHATNTARIKDQ